MQDRAHFADGGKTNDTVKGDLKIHASIVGSSTKTTLNRVVSTNMPESSAAAACNGKTELSSGKPRKRLTKKEWRRQRDFRPVAMKKAVDFYTGRGYQPINKYLRTGEGGNEKERGRKIRRYVEQIETYLSGLPSLYYQQRLYRGVRDADKYYDLEPGKIFRDKAFMSTSYRSDTAALFGRCSKDQYLFEITSHFSGKDIENQGEAEILFPPGCSFMIDRVEGNYVWMHEIDPSQSEEPSLEQGDAKASIEESLELKTTDESVPTPKDDKPYPVLEASRLDCGADGTIESGSAAASTAMEGPGQPPIAASVAVEGPKPKIATSVATSIDFADDKVTRRRSRRNSTPTDGLGSTWVDGRRRSNRK